LPAAVDSGRRGVGLLLREFVDGVRNFQETRLKLSAAFAQERRLVGGEQQLAVGVSCRC
jgi:hypothetical protein